MGKRIFQSERRIEPRVRTDGLIGVRITVDTRTEQGNLFDINNHGAFIATAMDIELGRSVYVEIEVPGVGRMAPIYGEVVRRKEELGRHGDATPSGIGIRFVAKSQEEWDRIHVTVQSTLALDLLDSQNVDGLSNKDTDRTVRFGPRE